jgi:SAM-dependent methyltransferase
VRTEDHSLHPASRSRFSGFADLYDANRPSPPRRLGHILAGYANTSTPAVVDLGSGTGLSSRWAAQWASSVIGIEPNDDMRQVARSRPLPGIEYRARLAQDTGLPPAGTDVVLVVQAMHWMEPTSTLAEAARVLRPGGVLAVIDADWPPVAGVVRAERAWAELHGRIRVLEARLAAGEDGDQLRRSISDDDPALAHEDLVDPHRHRVMPDGLQSWSKSSHLDRMRMSGHFAFTREIVLSEVVEGGPERFVALMYSQGSFQGLLKAGLSPEEIGATRFEEEVAAGFAGAASPPGLSFSWRARIGATPPRARH